VRAFDLAKSIPWAIRLDALQAILDLASRAEVSPEVVAAAMTSGSPQAVAARLGRPLDNARTVSMRGSVAVIPVSGPIFRHANLFSEVSGATSSEVLATDLHAALDDPAVAAIMLEVDSPGGEVAGTAELAAMIRAADAQKPVHAYVDSLGASAAYWISSAASRVIVAPTAIVGSIGVVSALSDPSKTKSTDVEFVSSQSPKKRADITTEAGRAQVQAVVDALADVFVSDVAQYRGVSTDQVLSDFGQGDVFVGAAAVEAGLADAVGSFEQAIIDLTAEAVRRATPAVRGKGNAVTIRDRFNAWLDGLDAPASADQEAIIVAENLNPPVVPQPAPTAAQPPADVTALTARMAALEAENLALKASGETHASALKAATDHLAAMQTQARRNRFTDEVLGRGDANGARWFGEVAAQVQILETLADACGEDSDQFKAYVTQQRAVAEQIKTSKLFTEIGSGMSGESGATTVAGRVEAAARKLMAADPSLTLPAAIDKAVMSDSSLAAEYVNEQRTRTS
jgi:signal peptide peptidase SppA